MKKTVVESSKFPRSSAPYSFAVRAGEFVYIAGQTARDFSTGKYFTDADIRSQTKQVCENLKTILEAAGTSLDNVIKTTAFIADWNDYDGMNEVYRQYFVSNYPARSTVQVAKLNRGLRVEIEAVAVIP